MRAALLLFACALMPMGALAMDADTALEKWRARHPVEAPLPVAATVAPVARRSPLCGNVPARYYGTQIPERWTDECKTRNYQPAKKE